MNIGQTGRVSGVLCSFFEGLKKSEVKKLQVQDLKTERKLIELKDEFGLEVI